MIDKPVKVNITAKDYQWNGLGFNSFNLIKNITPRISNWLLNAYAFYTAPSASLEMHNEFAEKLEKIAQIIDG